ncbi:MAG: hypothetical protein GF308_02270 [Candidatus Heimdallarchaeota archaeon]|nr:hypothetical protein [Candidatus Heimdallarchaeota archaeon]
MKVLIIFAHPNPNSFCAAIKANVESGLKDASHQVKIHDLYEDQFDPILSKEELLETQLASENPRIKQYQQDLLWAKIIIIIHPAWWYGPPAILKGYFDRVLEPGFAHEYVNDQPIPQLTDKKGILIQTFDSTEKMEKEVLGNVTYKTIVNTWKYCGITEWKRFAMFRILFSTETQRKEWLQEAYLLGKELEKKKWH